MLHQMKLQTAPFHAIEAGRKTIELRLLDEKRERVQVGDFIEFALLEQPNLKMQTRVTALHRFPSFAELYAAFPKEAIGYADDAAADPSDMEAYYSREEQQRYGVLGIELYPTKLQRFLDAQEHGYSFGETYQTALAEIQNGRKVTHWIWYVFPQIRGLGKSSTTARFSIQNLAEARDYYAHPILGARLLEITEALLQAKTDDPMVIFGRTDAFKLRSCMTLFKAAAPEQPLFQQVLDRFCLGNEDERTLARLV